MHTQLIPLDHEMIDKQVESEMEFVQKMIESIRTIRGELNIAPSKDIQVIIRLSPRRTIESIRRYEGYLQRLAKIASVSFVENEVRPRHAANAVVDGEEFFVPLEGIIDLNVERTRLKKEMDRIAGIVTGISGKLNNENFLSRAPKDVVEKEREKLDTFARTLEKLTRTYEALG